MAIPTRDKTPACEQCGAPLLGLAGEEGCLNCLLSTGIEGEPEDAQALPNEPVRRIYQHYEVLTRLDGSLWELGRGAMGVTYKARDVNLDTLVALKVINARFSARPEARRRFLHEAQAAAQLRHPNVASVFHFGTIDDTLPAAEATSGEKRHGGDCFYAMEFVDGESLETHLRRTGPLGVEFALDIALQVARALVAAEKRGLVHRDLKPSNIMLAVNEEIFLARDALGDNRQVPVKVIDFGLAKLVGDERDSTTTGRFLGTRAFSSPEQKLADGVDRRSDIYSLGATLWYSLTGKLPGVHPANTLLPVDQLTGRRIPAPVIALLRLMLAPDPEDRPHSAVQLTEVLQRCLDAVDNITPSSRQRARRWAVAAGLSFASSLVVASIYFAPLSAPQDKSVAVLPFRNLSNDPANAFFAEGVQDDILSRLVKVRDLKVINHVGASRFQANAPRDLRAIGRTLGVRHLLEGSLRRAGDRVLLHVSLIDTRDGHEVWSEGYDRKLVDAINLQGELASKIADALDAKLSPRERGDVRADSTRNPDAYVLYLRGRKLEKSLTVRSPPTKRPKPFTGRPSRLTRILPWPTRGLPSTLSLLYRFRAPSPKNSKLRAYCEAREALRLQPELGEGHLAKAFNDYRIERDFDRALPELEVARRLLPNDTEPESTIAFIRRRQRRWREARRVWSMCSVSIRLTANMWRSCTRPLACFEIGQSAASHAVRASLLAPKMDPLKGERALVAFLAKRKPHSAARVPPRPERISGIQKVIWLGGAGMRRCLRGISWRPRRRLTAFRWRRLPVRSERAGSEKLFERLHLAGSRREPAGAGIIRSRASFDGS